MSVTLKRIFWASFIPALVIYGVMVAWSLPKIAAAAGGDMPFDMRPFGYGGGEATTFLTQLSDAGRAHYLHVQHWLDTFYPGLLALALGSGIALLTPPKLAQWKWLLAFTAVPGMVFDYLENQRVAGLLLTPAASVNEAAIAAASQATLLKSLFTTLAMSIFLILLITWLVRRVMARRPS